MQYTARDKIVYMVYIQIYNKTMSTFLWKDKNEIYTQIKNSIHKKLNCHISWKLALAKK